MSIQSEIQKLSPSSIIELYELDATDLGAGLFYFHSGTNELNGNITWQGVEYTRYPIEVTGFDISGQGQLPRPKLKVSNYLSAISIILMAHNDLVGAKLTRKRTLKKFLDAVNFEGGVNPDADTTAHFADDIFYIDRKSIENRDVVEFELASSIDLAGVMIPRRQIIANLCSWGYRSAECGYTGTDYFLIDDTVTLNPDLDRCGKRLSSCKLRFGENNELPYGGFPGSSLIRQ